MAQVGRASFTHVRYFGFKLSSLVQGRVNASISHQLFEAGETLDVADLSQDSCCRCAANARDSGEILFRVLQQRIQSGIDVSDLGFEELDLLQQAVQFKAGSISEEGDADRLRGGIDDLLGFAQAEASSASRAEQGVQFIKGKVGEFLSGNRFLQQTPRGTDENVGEEGFILGEDAIQDRDDFAFAVSNLLDEAEAEAC